MLSQHWQDLLWDPRGRRVLLGDGHRPGPLEAQLDWTLFRSLLVSDIGTPMLSQEGWMDRHQRRSPFRTHLISAILSLSTSTKRLFFSFFFEFFLYIYFPWMGGWGFTQNSKGSFVVSSWEETCPVHFSKEVVSETERAIFEEKKNHKRDTHRHNRDMEEEEEVREESSDNKLKKRNQKGEEVRVVKKRRKRGRSPFWSRDVGS